VHKTLQMIAVLALISMVSGVVLAVVYEVTLPDVQAHRQAELRRAILDVCPGAKSFRPVEVAAGNLVGTTEKSRPVEEKEELEIYEGLDGSGSAVGYAYVAEGPGFQGVIRLIVGLDTAGERLTGIKILKHLETPGLGARITEDWFQDQFKGKSVDDSFVAKEDVEAITGATISSRAVSSIIRDTLPDVLQIVK